MLTEREHIISNDTEAKSRINLIKPKNFLNTCLKKKTVNNQGLKIFCTYFILGSTQLMSQKIWVFYFKLNLYQFAWDLLQNNLISREYIISKISTDHLHN